MTTESQLRRHWGLWTAAVFLLLGGFAAGWILARQGKAAPEAASPATQPSATQPDESPTSDRPQQYTCSMHPQIRSSDPKAKCPICGMDLIPVPADGDDDDHDAALPLLRVSQRSAALMQVRTWPVERRPVQVVLRLLGRVDYDETRLHTITAWVPGRLDRLHVNFTGAVVEPQQPLADIYSPALLAAQEELLQARQAAQANDRPAALAAVRDKLRLWGLDAAQIQQIEDSGQVREHLTISAPAGGTVTQRLVTQGTYVETGSPLFTVADLSRVWVRLEVYESDLSWLRLDQHVTLKIEAYPGEEFEGTVTFIDPVLDDRKRSVGVRVEAPNPDGRLKPGMLVRAMVSASVDEADPLVIPASAPLITGQRAVVYVQQSDTDRPTFEARQVVLGPRAGDHYIVREGLAEGELVVIHGQFKIDSELQIRGRPSMMAPADAPQSPDTVEAPARVPAPEPFIKAIGALIQANFPLVDALAQDDPIAARHAAEQAREALTGVDPTLLDEPLQQPWRQALERMHAALMRLAEAADLRAQRVHFEAFSKDLILAARSFGAGDAGPVYLAMCPMVEGRRGYWLQARERITNPYFGASMPRCGEIVETLEATPPAEEHRH